MYNVGNFLVDLKVKKKKKKKKKHNLHIKSSKHILEVKLHSVNYLKSLLQEDDKKSTYKSYWT